MHEITFTKIAVRLLKEIADSDIRRTIMEKAEVLRRDPEKQGKALLYTLKGLRSIPAAGRYRIMYQAERAKMRVIVLVVGKRKEGDKADVYELTKKLLRHGLI
jgi:mRNA interferase RelE/StbE